MYQESLYAAKQRAMHLVEICSPLFNVSTADSFLFIKFCAPNRMIALSTHASWLDNVCNNQHWLIKPDIIKTYEKTSYLNFFAQLWSSTRSSVVPISSTLRQKSGLHLWRRNHQGLSLWSFASFASIDIENWVNDIDEFKLFANHFENQCDALIKEMIPYAFQLNAAPSEIFTAEQNCFKHFVDSTPIKYFPIMLHGEKRLITLKQALCLQGLCEGKSSKELAKMLQLSPRTIEKHVENLKFILDVQHKNEMMMIYKASRDYWL